MCVCLSYIRQNEYCKGKCIERAFYPVQYMIVSASIEVPSTNNTLPSSCNESICIFHSRLVIPSNMKNVLGFSCFS